MSTRIGRAIGIQCAMYILRVNVDHVSRTIATNWLLLLLHQRTRQSSSLYRNQSDTFTQIRPLGAFDNTTSCIILRSLALCVRSTRIAPIASISIPSPATMGIDEDAHIVLTRAIFGHRKHGLRRCFMVHIHHVTLAMTYDCIEC
jgi:hypothetical protein